MAKWDVKQIEYVARLARLDLSPAEKEKFSRQLAEITKYIEKLNQLDTTKVEPTAHILPLKNVWREDEVKDSLPRKDIERIMPEGSEGFFKVPPVLE